MAVRVPSRARGPLHTSVPLSTPAPGHQGATTRVGEPSTSFTLDPSLIEHGRRLRQSASTPAGPWAVLSPAGGGRTTGLNYLCASGRASGYRVCAARWAGSADVPFQLIYDLVTNALTTATAPRRQRSGSSTGAVDGWRADEVTALQGVLEHLLMKVDDPSSAHDAVRDALHAVVEIWTRSAPTLIAIDDLHRADTASADVLVDLLRRLGDLPVLVVFAVRSEDLMTNSLTADVFARICQGPTVDRIRIAPLTVGQVGDMAADRWNLRIEPTLARRLHTETGGNPSIVHTALDMLHRQGRVIGVDGHAVVPDLGAGLVLPPSHPALAPIREQGATAARVASVAASMPDLTLRQLRSLALGAGVDTTVAGRVVDWLTAVGILHREGALRFASPVVRNTLLAQLGPFARAEIARIGQFDARSSGPDSGAAAGSAHRYGTGIDRFSTSDGHHTDDDETMMALRTLHRGSQWQRVIELTERLLAGDADQGTAASTALGLLARAHVAVGHPGDALAALNHWHDRPGIAASDTVVHRAMALLYQAQPAAARDALRQASPDADLAWAKGRIDAAEGGADDYSASHVDPPSPTAGMSAREIWSADPLHDEVTAAFRAGRWDDALRAARRDRAERNIARDPVGEDRVTTYATTILVARGHYRRARAWLDETATDAPAGVRRFLVRAELESSIGRHEEAGATLVRAAEFIEHSGVRTDVDLLHFALVEAALSRGDREAAVTALAELTAVCDKHSGENGRLLVATATTLVHEDPAAADRAVQIADAGDELFIRARCSLAAGSVGDSATLRLSVAHELFRGLRAEPWCCRTRSAMRRRSVSVPRDPEKVRGLGHTDRLLVSLVAEGLANRQIARVLACSTKTVEGRLGRLFEATGRSSRTSLVAAYLAGELERERVPSTT